MVSLMARMTSKAPTVPIKIDSRFVTLAQLAMMLASPSEKKVSFQVLKNDNRMQWCFIFMFQGVRCFRALEQCLSEILKMDENILL